MYYQKYYTFGSEFFLRQIYIIQQCCTKFIVSMPSQFYYFIEKRFKYDMNKIKMKCNIDILPTLSLIEDVRIFFILFLFSKMSRQCRLNSWRGSQCSERFIAFPAPARSPLDCAYIPGPFILQTRHNSYDT